MPSPLLPSKLSAPVIMALSGRSRVAVWKARKAGALVSFATLHVEAWIGHEIDPISYLRAERHADATDRAYMNAYRLKQRSA